MAQTTITWVTNTNGTATVHWTDDANPNLEDYLVTVDGVTTKYPVSVDSLVLSATPHTVTVQPELSPEATSTSTYTPPPPVLKPLMNGLLFRGAVVASLLQYFVGQDVYGPEEGAIGMDQLFPTGPTLAPNNPIDVQGLAAQKISSSFGLNVRPEFGFHTPKWMMNLDGPPVTITDPTTGKTGQVPVFWLPDGKFWPAAQECYDAIAAKYDGVEWFRKFIFCTGSTAYSEGDIRQAFGANGPANVKALLNAGFEVALDLAARQRDFAFLPTVFKHTPLGQAFNEYQSVLSQPVVSAAETSALVADFVGTVGKQASVENNSVRYPQIQYPVLYGSDMPKALAAGASVNVQLASAAQVGNEFQAAEYAIKTLKVKAIEMTGQVAQNITPAQGAQLRTLILANA